MDISNRNLCNILDFGGVRTGDKVEFVRIYLASFSFDHGMTTVCYRTSAYLELANGDIVDGTMQYQLPHTMIIVNGKAYPCVPSKKTLREVLSKLQSGGKALAGEYRRILGIIGEGAGLVLEHDDGRFYYADSKGKAKTGSRRAGMLHVEQVRNALPRKGDATHIKSIPSWREKNQKMWEARERKMRWEALEPPVPICEEGVDLRLVLSGLGE